MKLLNMIKDILKNNKSGTSAPLFIIQKDSNSQKTKEYSSIENAIADLQNDLNIPKEKLVQLRKSLNNLKHKSSIRIMNGEIVE